jgi:hypothetical protein
MRFLIVAVVAFASLWGGWWWVAATGAERVARAMFDTARAGGIEATVEDISVSGFPNRVDMTFAAPVLNDPASGWGWQAEFVQFFALTYNPWRHMAAFSPVQRLSTPLGSAVLATDKAMASLRLGDGLDFAFEDFRLDLAAPALSVLDAGEMRAQRAFLALRRAPGTFARYEAHLDIEEPAADPRLVAALADSVGLPHHLETLRLALGVEFDAPLDRHATARPPVVLRIAVTEARLRWGSIEVSAEGEIVPDALGRAEGVVMIRVSDWKSLLAVAVSAGWIAPGDAPRWERIATLIGGAGAPEGGLIVPLGMGGGQMLLGPVPIGPAPFIAPPRPAAG